ncbi:MAG: SET domain-containing protein-lysine N-methyltransferase [Proteobacteria bacterium]|nr:SET domain-containing protein-lysine N-methyltransferase [Pseudomonadota bacterium]
MPRSSPSTPATRKSAKSPASAPAPRKRAAQKPAGGRAAKPLTPPAAKPGKGPLWVVRYSDIHGRGVFAARTIRKNKKVIEYQGERTTWEDAQERPDSDPDNPYHTFLFGLDDGNVIDAAVGGNEARWINHSCKPNCETEEDEDGRVFIRARRKIEAGEELTYDYQLTFDGKLSKKEKAAYACRCGAKKCRGTMLGKKRKKH